MKNRYVLRRSTGMLVVVCGVAVVLALRWNAEITQAATVALCALVGGAAVSVLRQRQLVAATRLPVGGLWRLGAAALALAAVGLLAAGVGFARFRAEALVHPGRHVADQTPEEVGLTEYQTVSFPATDGLTLRGWYVPPHNGAVVIGVHGFAGNRSAFLEEAALLAQHGYGALLFDLRNAGESEGTLTTMGLQEVKDVQGAVNFVLAQPGVDAGRIGLMGISMGGATVIMAAARTPQVSAVVAESAYMSLEDSVGITFQQMTGLPSFPFAPLVVFFGEQEAQLKISEVRPIDDIAAISPRPILLVHGGQDPVIPLANGHALYAAAQSPKDLYVIDQAGHGGFFAVDPEEYARRLLEFWDQSLLEP